MGTHCGHSLLSEQLVNVVVGNLARDVRGLTTTAALLLLLDFVDKSSNFGHLLEARRTRKPDEDRSTVESNSTARIARFATTEMLTLNLVPSWN